MARRAEPTIETALEIIETSRLGRWGKALPPPLIRGLLAATSGGRNHLFLRLAVDDEGDDKQLSRSWARAVQAIVDCSQLDSWGSKTRRTRTRALAKNARILRAIQGMVANEATPDDAMLAVLVADGSAESIDALVPHFKKDNLELWQRLRIHAKRTPALDALFGEVAGELADRTTKSPAHALGPLIGIGQVDSLWFEASLSSDEQAGTVPRYQGHIKIDSRDDEWFDVSIVDIVRLDRWKQTQFGSATTGDDALKLDTCDAAGLPAWLAHAAAVLGITWAPPVHPDEASRDQARSDRDVALRSPLTTRSQQRAVLRATSPERDARVADVTVAWLENTSGSCGFEIGVAIGLWCSALEELDRFRAVRRDRYHHEGDEGRLRSHVCFAPDDVRRARVAALATARTLGRSRIGHPVEHCHDVQRHRGGEAASRRGKAGRYEDVDRGGRQDQRHAEVHELAIGRDHQGRRDRDEVHRFPQADTASSSQGRRAGCVEDSASAFRHCGLFRCATIEREGHSMGPTPEQLRFRALVERIETDPDDSAAWIAYGEALAKKNDLRGELIRRQHASDDFAAFVDANAAAIFGDAAGNVVTAQDPNRPFRVLWTMGSASRVYARLPSAGGDLLPKLQQLLERPICQFLRGLHVELADAGSTADIIKLLKPTYAHNLRELEVVSCADSDRSPRKLVVDWLGIHIAIPELDTLRLSGRLERLYHPAEPAQIDSWYSETVKRVELTNDNFLPEDFATLGAWRLPVLERLELDLRSTASYADAPGLKRMFSAPELPTLRALEIRGCHFTELLLECLARSAMLAQLQELDLSLSELGDEDLAFIEREESFRRLGLTVRTSR